jgi:hypothetical protein
MPFDFIYNKCISWFVAQENNVYTRKLALLILSLTALSSFHDIR